MQKNDSKEENTPEQVPFAVSLSKGRAKNKGKVGSPTKRRLVGTKVHREREREREVRKIFNFKPSPLLYVHVLLD